jgi:murein DD-endopeptidase MepM/ murein hydrolase activator NlpD
VVLLSLIGGLTLTTAQEGDVLNNSKNMSKTPSSKIELIWPVGNRQGHITLNYGENLNPFTKKSFFHKGIDIAYHRGTEVKAAAKGNISMVGFDEDSKGFYVEIQHENGMKTLYTHLMKNPEVMLDQIVDSGEVIGFLGNTGKSTGPHLHFEIWQGKKSVNPEDYLDYLVEIQ